MRDETDFMQEQVQAECLSKQTAAYNNKYRDCNAERKMLL